MSPLPPGVLRDVRNQLGRVRALAAHLGVETLPQDEWDALLNAVRGPALLLLANVEAGCDGLDTGTHGFLRRTLRDFVDCPGRVTARAVAPATRVALHKLECRPPGVEVAGMLRTHGAPRATAPPLRHGEPHAVASEVAQAIMELAWSRSHGSDVRRWRGSGPAPP